ncbi:MAG: M15 family metallopeptidase [Peptococcaceae bacterium]|jgi:D-alanyl-D-alanine carboxypeptidase|nr:M15 family metallopeptidase [Peptococcaceae bacterium]
MIGRGKSGRFSLKGLLCLVLLVEVAIVGTFAVLKNGYSPFAAQNSGAGGGTLQVKQHSNAGGSKLQITQNLWAGDIGTGGADADTVSPVNMRPFSVPVGIVGIADTRCLELINRSHGISMAPDGGLLVHAWPSVPVSTQTIILHNAALEAVTSLFAAAREAQAGTFYVGSGYRDYEKQKEIYDSATDKSYVQPPNHSEHQTGLAVDIFVIGIHQSMMAGSPEGRWLAENAWKYGLTLRYTEDKKKYTQIAGEPWHFRYMGQPHAWFCAQYDLCFEEYIQFLGENGGYCALLDGKSYFVLYQSPKDGMIYVPESMDYSISNDNTGGYIVTAWE